MRLLGSPLTGKPRSLRYSLPICRRILENIRKFEVEDAYALKIHCRFIALW